MEGSAFCCSHHHIVHDSSRKPTTNADRGSVSSYTQVYGLGFTLNCSLRAMSLV